MDYEQGPAEQDVASKPAADTKPASLPPEVLDTDFKRKYPSDAELGKELDDGARVWKVFRDEATAHDTSMLDGWNKTLDILLIFAGLFSAVATAFIVESYKLLQPDDTADYTATALYALVLATNNSAALRLLPPLPAPSMQVTASSLWINGLWFTSLFLSLAVSLLCILVKQWLGEYSARTTASATNILWSRRRAFYFDGLSSWHLAGFISVLPLLLHLALFLFFGGLGVFLWTLDRGIGAWLAIVSIALLLFYAVSTALPFWWPECPTSTPLVNQMQTALIQVVIFALKQCITILPILSRLAQRVRRSVHVRIRAADPEAPVPPSPPHPAQIVATLKTRLAHLVAHDAKSTLHDYLYCHRDSLDAFVLRWLILGVSHTDPIAVGLQAIGALRPWSPAATLLRSDGILAACTFDQMCTSATHLRSATEHVRIVRSMLCLHGNQLNDEKLCLDVPRSVLQNLWDLDYPDTCLLAGSLLNIHHIWSTHAATWRAMSSPSLTSTALLLLHCPGITRTHALHVLICLQLEQLSSDDWSCVLRALRSALPACSPNRHPNSQCTTACRADFFARMITQPDTVRFDKRFDRKDPSLLAELVEHALSASIDYVARIWSFPYLVQFLASDVCLTVDFSSSALCQLGWTMTGQFFDRVPVNVAQMSLLHPAISNILHHAAHRRWDGVSLSGAVSTMYVDLLGTELNSWDHPVYSADDGYLPLAAVLAFLLHRREGLSVHASHWEMISSLHLGLRQLTLAGAVSGALCTLARGGEDVASMVDLFFLPRTSLDALRFAQWRMKKYGSAKPERFLRLAQHCIELRPSWWFALMNTVADDGDKDLIEFAVKVDTLLAQRGPCLKCRGDPPGWDTEDRLSVCSFHA